MNERISFIDYWRGISIYGMIVYHFVFDLRLLNVIDLGLIGEPKFELFANFFRFSFLFLVGVSAYIFLLRNISKNLYRIQFNRFFTIFLCSILVSISTYLFDSDSFVFFGVLHLISLSSLYFIMIRRNEWFVWITALFIVLLNLFDFSSSSIFIQILGYADITRDSADFFPIFPWFLVTLAGFLSCKYLLNFYKYLSCYINDSFTAKIGRKSLFIYMIHQPILIGFILLLQNTVLSK